MKNVEQYYWVVGILEHFEETLEALELALPYYFKGSRVVNAISKTFLTLRLFCTKISDFFTDCRMTVHGHLD